jgi:hypothetical protein
MERVQIYATKMSAKLERERAHPTQKTCTCSLFLLEGGIPGQSDQNKKYAGGQIDHTKKFTIPHAIPCHIMPSCDSPCQPMPALASPCQPLPAHASPCQPMPAHIQLGFGSALSKIFGQSVVRVLPVRRCRQAAWLT